MKKKIKIILIGIAAAVVICTVFGIIDYNRALSGKKPIFVYRNVNQYTEGELIATKYYGPGYAIVVCNGACIDSQVKMMPLYLGTYAWFIGNSEVEDDITFEIKKSNTKELKQLIFSEISSYVKPLTYRLYTYGLDEIKITIDNNQYQLEEALRSDKITIEDIIEKLEYDTTICYCNGRKETYADGKSSLYISPTYNISLLSCKGKTDDEYIKDYYISSVDMEYEEGLCK